MVKRQSLMHKETLTKADVKSLISKQHFVVKYVMLIALLAYDIHLAK